MDGWMDGWIVHTTENKKNARKMGNIDVKLRSRGRDKHPIQDWASGTQQSAGCSGQDGSQG